MNVSNIVYPKTMSLHCLPILLNLCKGLKGRNYQYYLKIVDSVVAQVTHFHCVSMKSTLGTQDTQFKPALVQSHQNKLNISHLCQQIKSLCNSCHPCLQIDVTGKQEDIWHMLSESINQIAIANGQNSQIKGSQVKPNAILARMADSFRQKLCKSWDKPILVVNYHIKSILGQQFKKQQQKKGIKQQAGEVSKDIKQTRKSTPNQIYKAQNAPISNYQLYFHSLLKNYPKLVNVYYDPYGATFPPKIWTKMPQSKADLSLSVINRNPYNNTLIIKKDHNVQEMQAKQKAIIDQKWEAFQMNKKYTKIGKQIVKLIQIDQKSIWGNEIDSGISQIPQVNIVKKSKTDTNIDKKLKESDIKSIKTANNSKNTIVKANETANNNKKDKMTDNKYKKSVSPIKLSQTTTVKSNILINKQVDQTAKSQFQSIKSQRQSLLNESSHKISSAYDCLLKNIQALIALPNVSALSEEQINIISKRTIKIPSDMQANQQAVKYLRNILEEQSERKKGFKHLSEKYLNQYTQNDKKSIGNQSMGSSQKTIEGGSTTTHHTSHLISSPRQSKSSAISLHMPPFKPILSDSINKIEVLIHKYKIELDRIENQFLWEA